MQNVSYFTCKFKLYQGGIQGDAIKGKSYVMTQRHGSEIRNVKNWGVLVPTALYGFLRTH